MDACGLWHASIHNQIVLDMFMLRLDRTVGTKKFFHRCIIGESLGNQLENFGSRPIIDLFVRLS